VHLSVTIGEAVPRTIHLNRLPASILESERRRFYATKFNRQQVCCKRMSSQSAFEAARRNLQNAQQKLASLNHQLEGIAASLDGDPTRPVENPPPLPRSPRAA